MAKYIHVVSATKTPENRGSSGTPFEEWATDPNLNPAFGPGERTMFLLVEEPAAQTVNPVLVKLVTTYTDDIAGKRVRGEYIPGDEVWRFTWTEEPQDLEAAKAIQKAALLEDQAAKFAEGYIVGGFTFPFTEDFFQLLQTRYAMLNHAITRNDVPGDTKMTFADRNGKEVKQTLAQLGASYSAYGVAYLTIFEKEVTARSSIEDATTPAEVDAVTWSF